MSPQTVYPVPVKAWIASILLAILTTLVVGCTRSEVQETKTVGEEAGILHTGISHEGLLAAEEARRNLTQVSRGALLASPKILTPQNSPELFRLHPALENQMNGDSARYKEWLDNHPEVLEDATPDLYRVDRNLSDKFTDQSQFASFLVQSGIADRLDSRIAHDVAMRAEAAVLARAPNVTSLSNSEKEALFSQELLRQIGEAQKRGTVGLEYRSGKVVVKLKLRNVSIEQEFRHEDLLKGAAVVGGVVAGEAVCVHTQYEHKRPLMKCVSLPKGRTLVTTIPQSQQVELDHQ